MNNLEFGPQVSQQMIRLLHALINKYEELEKLNDDDLQRYQKMKNEDPLRFLNLNQQNQQKKCSNKNHLKDRITERNNLIIENRYQCGTCFSIFLNYQQLGQHCWQYHSSKNLQSDSDTNQQSQQGQQQ
ncbi:unnamed protein product [Paramecium primaurelia]|uniref:C2H2-type domain-containing protein n=1 Tax=Paramecium primaurelia TaxID=5886 RepID=A0A8S1K7V3_PARPR|nr:unnamed protein product [Paramecium primaurelia]